MLKLVTMLALALDFAPGYKRLTGGIMLAAVGAVVGYNNFVAPAVGLPVVPAEIVEALSVGGQTILGVGVATAVVRK